MGKCVSVSVGQSVAHTGEFRQGGREGGSDTYQQSHRMGSTGNIQNSGACMPLFGTLVGKETRGRPHAGLAENEPRSGEASEIEGFD